MSFFSRHPSRLALLLLLSLGCRREPPPAALSPIVVDARPSAPPPIAPPAVVLPAAAAVAAADPLAVPSIEISGEVELPSGMAPPPSPIYVYVCRGDCRSDKVQLLRRLPTTEHGTFLIEVVAEPGAELSIWAALDGGPGRPSRLYGQWAPALRVGPELQQERHDLKSPLRSSPPQLFPVPPPKPRS